MTQYDACLAIAGAIRDTSKEKFHEEMGLEPLHNVVGTGNCLKFIDFTKISFPAALFRFNPYNKLLIHYFKFT